jgi:hypothetical protein
MMSSARSEERGAITREQSPLKKREILLRPTFRTLVVHYLRATIGWELLAWTVDGGRYFEQLKYLRLHQG